MAYLALYRAFRPDTLDGVVRQEHIVKILRNQIESNRIGHAYLFCGPRGTGKTSIAKIFARAVNCEHPVNGSPCGACPICRALAAGNSLDISEIDAASNNGVDEMRDLRDKVQYPPVNGRYKVYIIDEVHMLSQGAFNALLKTLEEPPKHAIFILATTEAQKIPATILSRCMRFDFKLIPQEDLENHLKNILRKLGKEYEEEAVSAIARAGAGSVRDMLSIADMCTSYENGKLTYQAVNAVLGSADFSLMSELCGAMLSSNMPVALSLTEKILSAGKGIGVLVRDILQFLNDCAIAKMCRNAREILTMPDDSYRKIKEIADAADGHKLLRLSEIFAETESKLRYSTSARILLETAVMKGSMPETDYNIDALLSRVSALEEKLKNGVVSQEPAPVAASVAEKTRETVVPAAPVPAPAPAPAEDDFPPLPDEPVFDDYAYDPYAVAAPSGQRAGIKEKQERRSPKEERPVPPVEPVTPAMRVAKNEAPMSEKKVKKTLAPTDRSKAFGLFLRTLRKISKSGVLFTLCSELDCGFEGDTMVFTTDLESIRNALNRPEHRAAMKEALETIGVVSFDIRLKSAKSDDFKSKIEALKSDFPDVPVEIK